MHHNVVGSEFAKRSAPDSLGLLMTGSDKPSNQRHNKNVLSVGHEACGKRRVGTMPYQTVGSSERAQSGDPQEVWML